MPIARRQRQTSIGDGYPEVHCGSYDHEYKSIWLNPVIQLEERLYKREIENSHDIHAVAAHKTIDRNKKCWTSKKLAKNLVNYGDSPKFFIDITTR